MALAFPPDPEVGDIYLQWQWTGSAWGPIPGGSGGGGMSGMAAGQVPIAASATTITSSVALPWTVSQGGTGATSMAVNTGLGNYGLTATLLIGQGTSAIKPESDATGTIGTWGGGQMALQHIGNEAGIELTRVNGTAGAPTTILNGDFIGSIWWNGWTSNTWPAAASPAQLSATATQTWTTTARGCRLQFYTTANGSAGSTPTLTLDGGGNLYATGSITAVGGVLTSGPTAAVFVEDRAAAGANYLLYNSAGTIRLYNNADRLLLDATGNLTITGATATKPGGGSWAAPSERRLKSRAVEWRTGLHAVLALRPISYRYKNEEWNLDCDYVGLDADEGGDTIPEMRRALEESKGLDHTPVVFALVNAVKRLHERLEAVEAAR